MEKNREVLNPLESSVTNTIDEIDLKEIIVKLWQKRKFVLMLSGGSLLLGILIAFTSPVSYKAACTVVPQVGSKNAAGNLGGLASMVGINLGSGMTEGSLSPTVYPQIVNSVPFCKEIMKTPIMVEKSPTPITLFDYYTNDAYRSKSLLRSIKKYTIGLPGLILSASSPKSETSFHADSLTGQVISLSRNEKLVIDIIRNNIQFESNPKEGYIKFGYTFSEPEATAAISQQMFNVLERYVKGYKTQKQLDNLQFVEAGYSEARNDFLQKQAELAAFQDANRGLATATARTTERRLNSEYEVAFTVYSELAKQREQAKLAVKESAPVLTVIDPVVVPREKSNPRRAMIMAAFLFLGLVAGVGWVLVKPFFREIGEAMGKGDMGKRRHGA